MDPNSIKCQIRKNYCFRVLSPTEIHFVLTHNEGSFLMQFSNNRRIRLPDLRQRLPVIQQYPIFAIFCRIGEKGTKSNTEEELAKINAFIEDSLELFYDVTVHSLDNVSDYLKLIADQNKFLYCLNACKIHTADFKRRVGSFEQYNVFLYEKKNLCIPLPSFTKEQPGREESAQTTQNNSRRTSCAKTSVVASHDFKKRSFSRASSEIQSTLSAPVLGSSSQTTTAAVEKPFLSLIPSSLAQSKHRHENKKVRENAETYWSSFVLPPVLSLPPFSLPFMECGNHAWAREGSLKCTAHHFCRSFCSRKMIRDDVYQRIEHFRSVLGIRRSESALLCGIEDGSAHWSLIRQGVAQDLLPPFFSFPSLPPVSSLPVPIPFSEADLPVPVYSTLSHSDVKADGTCTPFSPCSPSHSNPCGTFFSFPFAFGSAPMDVFYSLDRSCTPAPSTIMKQEIRKEWEGSSSPSSSSFTYNSHASFYSVSPEEREKDARASKRVRDGSCEEQASYKENQDQQEMVEEEGHLRRDEMQKKRVQVERAMPAPPAEESIRTFLSSLPPAPPKSVPKTPLPLPVRESEWCEGSAVTRARKDPFLDISMMTTTTTNATTSTEDCENSFSAAFPPTLPRPSCRPPWYLLPSIPSGSAHTEEITKSERGMHSFLRLTSRLKNGVPLAVLSRCLTRLEHLRDAFLEYFKVICQRIRDTSPLLARHLQHTDSVTLPPMRFFKNYLPSTTLAADAPRKQEEEGAVFNGHCGCYKFPPKKKCSIDFHDCNRHFSSFSSTSFEKISSFIFLAVCQRFYPLQVICSAACFWGCSTHKKESLSINASCTLPSSFTSSSHRLHCSDVPLCTCSRHRALTMMQWLMEEEKSTTTTTIQRSTTAGHRAPCPFDCHSSFMHSKDRGNQEFSPLSQEDSSLFQEERQKESGEKHLWGRWSSIPWLIRCDVLMTYPKLSSAEQLTIMEELRQDYHYHYHQKLLRHNDEDHEMQNLHCMGSPCKRHELHDEVKKMASCANGEKSITTTRDESSCVGDGISPLLSEVRHSCNTSSSTNMVVPSFGEADACATAPSPSTCWKQTRLTTHVLQTVAGRDYPDETRPEEESDEDEFERWWSRSDAPVPLYHVLIGLLPPPVERQLLEIELQGDSTTFSSSNSRHALFPSCSSETESFAPSARNNNKNYSVSFREGKEEKRTTNIKDPFQAEQPSDIYAILRESMERHKKGGALRILWRGEGYLRVRSYYYSHWLKSRKQKNASETRDMVHST